MNKPQYVDYSKNPQGATNGSGAAQPGTEPPKPPAGGGDCAAAALQAFTVSVQDEVNGKCSNTGCHAAGGSGASKLALSPKDVAGNRDAMKKFLAGDQERIEKAFKGGKHTGGDLSQSLTLEETKSWLSAEAKCGA